MTASSPLPDHSVATTTELVAAAHDSNGRRIVARGALENAPSIRLAPGQVLCGEGDDRGVFQTYAQRAHKR